ncbi:MAG: rhamnulokinase [Sedimentisphaerales bacterium]|nr:rhamnulokinase [Sedimentisphaerales bacterium]
MKTYLAIDLGAESGRGVLVRLKSGKVEMEEIHRFANRPVRLGGTLFWDFPFLFAEILVALRLCVEKGVKVTAIGVDTWGVDFGLLGPNGQLLGNPVHYRDARTDGIHEYSNPIMTTQEVFEATAAEPWAISSLFQLLSMKKNACPVLEMARDFLNVPDLINYFLTGVKASEKTIVSTANLMDCDGRWSQEVIRRFKLPDMFHDLVEPGTTLGPITEEIQRQTGMGPVPVVATCGHDTSAVAAAVPAEGKNWAFLSCGTWSILGKLQDRPVTSKQAFEQGFCNEYTLASWFVCRNILGLWLVQELKRKWDTSTDAWDYTRITDEARSARSTGMFSVNDQRLMAPADMEETLYGILKETGQSKPASRGELVRCVLESLSLEYAYRLNLITELTGQKSETIYMIGGGIKNTLLCQLTADACGIAVHAGADQCTSLGNALTVAVAMGDLDGPEDVRKVMRNSFELVTYQPRDFKAWTAKLEQYTRMQSQGTR